MRSIITAKQLGVVGLVGTGLCLNLAGAQNSPVPPVSGTAESHKKHSGTSDTDALTENGPDRPNALAEARRAAARRSEAAEAAPESEAPKQPPPARIAPVLPTVQAVPPGPPQKSLTGEEFALIHVGSTEMDVLELLGPPSSRVVVPEDDGHLKESLQYWVKGVPMGTVRLDNGRVAEIEITHR